MTLTTNETVRVLLITDDVDLNEQIKGLFGGFKDEHYELAAVDSFEKGLFELLSNTHDVFLVDHRIGESDGLDLIRAATTGDCRSPIILLAANDDKSTDLDAMQAGATDYLVRGNYGAQLLERTIRYSLQQYRSLQTLKLSEMRFRSVIQSASDAIFLVNHQGAILLWNEAAEKIFGYAPDEVIGRSALMLMGERFAKHTKKLRMKRSIFDVLAHPSGRVIQAIGRRKNGTEFPLELSGSVWRSNGEVVYTAIIRDITERQKVSETLKESEERYRDLFENANDTIYVHDLAGNFISVNQTGERVFGYTREEAAKLHMAQVIAPEYLEVAKKQIAAKIAGKSSSTYEIDCLRKDGRRVSFEINSRVMFENGVPVAIQGIARDITDRRRAEEERDRLYNVSNDLLATISFDGTLMHINPAWEKTLGYELRELIGRSVEDITHEEDRAKTTECMGTLDQGVCVSFETRLVCKDGSAVWILWNSTPMESERIFYAVGRNITDRKHAEATLEFNALYDKLTNLPNRTNFMNHLEKAIEKHRRDSSKKFAVLFLDLDRFKIINDGLGHLIGDKLLVSIAERIKSALRPGDIVARLGGDEFTLLIRNVREVGDATSVAERIQKELSKPFRLDNYEVFSSASIGIIVSDTTNRKPEDFLRDADSAMYRAKDRGKARYEIFDDEMYIRNMNLLQVETDLRRAIDRDEFRVFYQPIVALETGEIVEVEALVRWEHAEYGLIAPDQFIEIAEETGLIIPIGEWVLRESCRQIKEWQQLSPRLADLSVSVNLSAKQLMHPALVGQVKECLASTNLNVRNLKLEVTESTVMENPETALGILNELSRFGVGLSTDDFGTGYSSLSYLHRFPFSRIKIDRSFIGKMESDIKSKAIVRTILMLGQNLGIEVVAEGIENAQQLNLLRSLRCRTGQGYLFSKPLNSEYAEKLLTGGLKPELCDQYIWDSKAVIEIPSFQ